MKNHEFMSSGLSDSRMIVRISCSIEGRVFVSSGFTGAVTDLESPLFPLKGHVFESPGLSGFVSGLEYLWFQVQGHMLESSCLSGYWFETQGFVSLLKEQVLASAGLLVTRCIANVSVGVEVISGSHAAAAISGDLYACSRKAVQASGRGGRPIRCLERQ